MKVGCVVRTIHLGPDKLGPLALGGEEQQQGDEDKVQKAIHDKLKFKPCPGCPLLFFPFRQLRGKRRKLNSKGPIILLNVTIEHRY